MFRTLYAKLAAILLLLVLALGIFFSWLSVFTSRAYFREVNQRLNAHVASHLVNEWDLLVGGEVNRPHLEEVFHTLMVANPITELYLLDNEGNILAYQAPDEKIKRHRVDLTPIESFLTGTAGFPILGDDPRDPHQRKVFSVAPVMIGGQRQGYIYVILGGEEYDSVIGLLQNSYILGLSVWFSLAGLAVALAVGLVAFALVTRRLRRLSGSVSAFEQSDFKKPERYLAGRQASRADEIDRLGHAFNRMADRIADHINELHEVDAHRREQIESVSHDLRKPLAAMQSHLETLQLKEASLGAEERREYLDIAIRNCSRLSWLVDDLFELAKLDSRHARLRPERFSLDELVQDVVHKFAEAAGDKEIDLGCDEAMQALTVEADIGLIERALDNLIANAIAYTPSGGSVTVGVGGEGSVARIEVSDTGVGISADDLPHVFDTFYRAGAASAGEGTGLGLAITRKIAELHGGAVSVESAVGAGSRFSFTLPL